VSDEQRKNSKSIFGGLLAVYEERHPGDEAFEESKKKEKKPK